MGFPSPSSSFTSAFILIVVPLIFPLLTLTASQSSLCRTSCGDIPINYPFGVDDGCGSPYYRKILACSYGQLQLRTPSGTYPVRSISYSDPHVLLADPFMWNCLDGNDFRPTRPFSLDTSTHFSLSSLNDYLFFNCSPEHVVIAPKPIFCERFPDRCDSSCDSASYLCRNLPECRSALASGTSCCSYYPKATESLRLMLKYCASYTSVHWKNVGETRPYDQVPEYGIRVDFDIPVTTSCLRCQDVSKGGGRCGFDTKTQSFLCLCDQGNVTTYCKDPNVSWHSKKNGVVAGTLSAVSVAGAVGIGAGVWYYLRKVKAIAPVTHGVQSNENRLF
ncbi:hypothetical protein Vadar_012687 [Vaccinium darrowii]|uniref:Uncharacterized protein n=1 Tax=Vaccinium darrowii TaxID=229202 RepID=A0ACB7X9B1_9ERIC|nr:hypothetical protein Vadar_012687 [Vaccinium darrowii]